MNASPWTLDLQVDAQSRLAKLNLQLPFDEVASNIAANLKILCCHKSEIAGTDFRRPVYSVYIGNDLFDQFFNSATGYRAQYFRSPWDGFSANAIFMRTVSETLMNNGFHQASGLGIDFIRESLSTPSAKAWLSESGKELVLGCHGCQGEWSVASAGDASTAEVRNNRWEVAQGVKAHWGRKAPYFTKLRIMGSFLDSRLNEFVPFDKRFRAEEIHKFGWS